MVFLGLSDPITDESLRLFAAVAGVGRPAASDVEFLRRWLQRPSIGNNFLTGLESSIWAPENDKDLLCLMAQREESDWFSDFLREKMLSLYHYVFGRRTQVSILIWKVRRTVVDFHFGANSGRSSQISVQFQDSPRERATLS